MRVIVQALMALALAGLTAWWFGLVLPPAAAMLFAVAVGIAAAYGMIVGQWRFGFILVGGPVLASWPAGALLAQWLPSLWGFSVPSSMALAWSWVAPLAAWHLTYALAQRRDAARDYGGLAAGGVLLYLAAAVVAGSSAERLGAAVGIAAGLLAAATQLLVAPELDRALRAGAGLAGLAAAAYAFRALAGL